MLRSVTPQEVNENILHITKTNPDFIKLPGLAYIPAIQVFLKQLAFCQACDRFFSDQIKDLQVKSQDVQAIVEKKRYNQEQIEKLKAEHANPCRELLPKCRVRATIIIEQATEAYGVHIQVNAELQTQLDIVASYQIALENLRAPHPSLLEVEALLKQAESKLNELLDKQLLLALEEEKANPLIKVTKLKSFILTCSDSLTVLEKTLDLLISSIQAEEQHPSAEEALPVQDETAMNQAGTQEYLSVMRKYPQMDPLLQVALPVTDNVETGYQAAMDAKDFLIADQPLLTHRDQIVAVRAAVGIHTSTRQPIQDSKETFLVEADAAVQATTKKLKAALLSHPEKVSTTWPYFHAKYPTLFANTRPPAPAETKENLTPLLVYR